MVNAYCSTNAGNRAAKRSEVPAYSRYVGRVGALAIALGVGFAAATSPGVAWAGPEAESNAPKASESESTGDAPNVDPPSTGDTGTPEPADGEPAPTDGEPAPATTKQTDQQLEVNVGLGDGPTVIIRSSGGAHDADDRTEVKPVEPAEERETLPEPAPKKVRFDPVSSPLIASKSVQPQHQAAPEPEFQPRLRLARVVEADDASNGTPVATFDESSTTRISALSVPAPAIARAPDPIAQFFAMSAALVRTASTLLTSVLHAVAVPAPGAPPDSPLLWAVLAVVRRQFNATFANSTPVLNPQQTSQDLDDRQVHGTLGADDIDGDPLTFSVPTSGLGAPAHGDVVIDQVNRTWTYTPEAGFSGGDTFTVTASDAAGFHLHGFGQEHTATSTVMVTVASVATDLPPVVKPPTPPSQPQAGTGAVTGTIGVIDPDGDPLTYAFADGGAPKYGTVQIDPFTGAYTYTPNQAGRLRAALGFGSTDSFTVVVTQGNSEPTPFARMASFAALEEQGFSETVTVNDIPIAGANLVVDGDPITVGQRPAGVVVTDRYAYVVNSQDGTVTLIDTDDNSIVNAPIAVGNFPVLAASGQDRVYIVNAGSGSVTVVDTVTNTVVGSVLLAPGASSPGLSPDGSRLFVTNSSNGGLYVVDTVTLTVIDADPSTSTPDPIIVGSPPVQNGLDYYVPNGGIAFSEDGSRVYVTRQHAEVVNGVYAAGSGDVVVIGNDQSDPATYLKRVGNPIILAGKVPAAAAVVGNRLYVGTMNVADSGPVGGQFPNGTVLLIDVDPASPSFHTVLDLDANVPGVNGIEVGPLPLNMAISPDKSLAYTVNLGAGTVSVIDLIANEKIHQFTYDSTPAGPGSPSIIGISADGTKLYITNYGENSVIAVRIT